METDRRETSLLMGVSLLVAIVAMVFFSMTMALRQVTQRRARWRELRDQVTQAQRRVQQAPQPAARDQLAAQAQTVSRFFITAAQVPAVREHLAALAAELGATLTWLPVTTPAPPSACLPGFEGCYQAQSLVGTVEASYRALAEFLARVTALENPTLSVRSAVVAPVSRGETPAALPRLKARVVLEAYLWTPGALPKSPAPALSPAEGPPGVESPGPLPSASPAAWARDPFDPRYVPTAGVDGLVLTGILWDPARPTCLINGAVLGPGGTVSGPAGEKRYTVVAITPDAVVLRGESREVVLAVSP